MLACKCISCTLQMRQLHRHLPSAPRLADMCCWQVCQPPPPCASVHVHILPYPELHLPSGIRSSLMPPNAMATKSSVPDWDVLFSSMVTRRLWGASGFSARSRYEHAGVIERRRKGVPRASTSSCCTLGEDCASITYIRVLVAAVAQAGATRPLPLCALHARSTILPYQIQLRSVAYQGRSWRPSPGGSSGPARRQAT